MRGGVGGSGRTAAVTLGSSLRWRRRYEESGLREGEPGQEEAPGAGEATFPGEGDGYRAGAGETEREKGAGQIISRGRGYAGTRSLT